jgi:hypothetical protein
MEKPPIVLLHLVNWYDERSLKEDVFAPVGSAYIEASLREAGYDVALQIYRYNPDDFHLPECLRGAQPLMIGVSATGNEINELKSLTNRLREAFPEVFLVAGGYCSLDEERLFQDSSLDAVVLGEGEATAVALARALEIGDDLRSIPGMLVRTRDGIVRTAVREQPSDLDALAMPVYDHLPADSGVIRVYASRGCPYVCSYCEIKDFYEGSKRIREHGLDYIRGLIVGLSARSSAPVERVYFNDDEFLLRASHLVEIAALARELQVKIVFQTRARDVITHRDVISQNVDVIYEVHMGVESFSASQLDRWKKRTSPEQNMAAVEILAGMAIPTYPYMILTDAQTTISEIGDSCAGLLALPRGPIPIAIRGQRAFPCLSPLERSVNLKRLKTFYGEIERSVDSLWLDDLWAFINSTEQAASSLSRVLLELRADRLLDYGRAGSADLELDESAVQLLRERIEHLPYLAERISVLDASKRRIAAQQDASAFSAEARMVCAMHAAATSARAGALNLVS